MNLIIDLDLNQVVQGFANKQPAPPFLVKSQDTPLMAIYFIRAAATYDLGSAPGIRFGLYEANNPNPLVQQTTFSYTTDPQNRVVYVGYPNFNTVGMIAAVGGALSIDLVGEVRYQTPFGTIARTLDIPFTVQRSLLQETILDHTTAAFTVPAVAANVTIAISNTGWLKAGENLQIATAGSYQAVSITDANHFVAQNMGGANNAAPTTVIPTGTSVGLASQIAVGTYPDPSTIELLVHKDVAGGYAGLNGSSQLYPAQIPVDTATIALNGSGQIARADILTTTAASFVTPAAQGTVTVTVNSTAKLIVNETVRFISAEYYTVSQIIDATHAVFTNNGDAANAVAGTTIAAGTALLLAQSVSASGTAGQNAYTATSASFTVPAVNATVTIMVGATNWMAGAGYDIFIAGAGYYQVQSITDAQHIVAINQGGSTNASPGTVIAANAEVSPSGQTGPAGPAGSALAAYDALTASFTVPASGSAVTISISNTGWLAVGQYIFIATAGQYQVASGGILSPTTASITNLGSTGNAAPATVIASGSRVTPSGPPGAAGTAGGTLTDAAGSTGNSIINAPSGILKKVLGSGVITVTDQTTQLQLASSAVATLVDGETTTGVTLIQAPSGAIKRLIAGSNITLDAATTPGGVIVNGSAGGIADAPSDGNLYGRKNAAWSVVPAAGGGGGMLDRTTAVEYFDDFLGNISGTNNLAKLGWFFVQDGGSGATLQGQQGGFIAAPQCGVWQINSQSSGTSGANCARLSLGPQSAGWSIGPANQGALVWEWRVLGAYGGLETTANYAIWRLGILGSSTGGGMGSWADASYFEYNVNLSANWRCIHNCSASLQQVSDSGVAVSSSVYQKLTCTLSVDWKTATFAINGTTVATLTNTAGWEAGIGWSPIVCVGLAAGAAAVSARLDWFYAKLSVTR